MARKIEVEIVGDSASLERALARAGKSGQSSLDKISRAAKTAGLALGGILAAGAVVGFKELMEGQKVAAQTAAVLKSTGGAAGVTAKDVEGLATELSELSGVDDEVIASSENLLLTFTNVQNKVGDGNDIFNQATKAILDMSVAMGTDLNSATVLVGKALNDPVRGLTALRRVGVSFSKDQEKVIEKLTETGHRAEAQKIILEELNKEFGKSAEAAGDTLPGRLNKLKNSFEETAGELVEGLLPAIEGLLGKLNTFAEWAQKNPKQLKIVVVALAGLTAALLTASVAQTALNFAVLANPYVAAAAAIAVLVAALIVLYQKFEFVRKHWQVFLLGIGAFAVVAATVAKAIVRHWGTIEAAFNRLKAVVGPIVGWFRTQMGGLIGTIMSVVHAVQTLISAVQTAVSWLGRLDAGSTSVPPGVRAAPQQGGGSALGGIVRRTGLEKVHAGEAIVPARVARGGHGSSGADWQLALVAIGPDLVRELQRTNARYARGNGGRSIW